MFWGLAPTPDGRCWPKLQLQQNDAKKIRRNGEIAQDCDVARSKTTWKVVERIQEFRNSTIPAAPHASAPVAAQWRPWNSAPPAKAYVRDRGQAAGWAQPPTKKSAPAGHVSRHEACWNKALLADPCRMPLAADVKSFGVRLADAVAAQQWCCRLVRVHDCMLSQGQAWIVGFEEPGSSSKTPFFFTGPTFFEVLEALGSARCVAQ